MVITCEICEVDEKKYKCPLCETTYCSIKCFQIHKSSNSCEEIKRDNIGDGVSKKINSYHCEDSEGEEENKYQFPTKDTVPIEKLKLLGTNSKILKLLENEHLRTILLALHQTKNINHAINMVMLEPIFVEFAMECLNIVQPQQINNDEDSNENEQIVQFIQEIKALVDTT